MARKKKLIPDLEDDDLLPSVLFQAQSPAPKDFQPLNSKSSDNETIDQNAMLMHGVLQNICSAWLRAETIHDVAMLSQLTVSMIKERTKLLQKPIQAPSTEGKSGYMYPLP